MNHSLADSSPGISIIIPVKGRLDLLARLLESIRVAVGAPGIGPCEVLILWDGQPSPDTLISASGGDVELVMQGFHLEADQVQKRNAGAQIAKFDTLLFVDSDCVIHPDLLRNLVQTFGDPQVVAAAPPVDFEPGQSRLEQASAVMPYRQAFGWGRIPQPQWWLPTATIAVRRSAFEASGGFWRPQPGPVRGEDVDFGLRVTRSLGRPAIWTLPNVPSTHARETWHGVGAALRRAWWCGWSEGDLYPRHPDFRRWSAPSLLLFAVLSGLVAAGMVFLKPWFVARLAGLSLLFLVAWFLLQAWRLRRARLPLGVYPAAFLLAGTFELARGLSLWNARTFVGGLWFHEHQALGAWPEHALTGWIILGLGLCTGILLLLVR